MTPDEPIDRGGRVQARTTAVRQALKVPVPHSGLRVSSAFRHTGGMRAYSVDLRERVVAAVDAGMPRDEAARVFGVSRATIKTSGRWRAGWNTPAFRLAVQT